MPRYNPCLRYSKPCYYSAERCLTLTPMAKTSRIGVCTSPASTGRPEDCSTSGTDSSSLATPNAWSVGPGHVLLSAALPQRKHCCPKLPPSQTNVLRTFLIGQLRTRLPRSPAILMCHCPILLLTTASLIRLAVAVVASDLHSHARREIGRYGLASPVAAQKDAQLHPHLFSTTSTSTVTDINSQEYPLPLYTFFSIINASVGSLHRVPALEEVSNSESVA